MADLPLDRAAEEFDMDENEFLVLLKTLPGKNFSAKRGKIMVSVSRTAELFDEHGIAVPDGLRRNPRRRRDEDDDGSDDDEDQK